MSNDNREKRIKKEHGRQQCAAVHAAQKGGTSAALTVGYNEIKIKMNRNTILILGSAITVVLIILWALEIIGEPIAALGGGILTLLGYLFVNEGENYKNESSIKNIKSNIQTHKGRGDNVGGDKITYK